ncbi:hypothetical protein [Marinobacter xestospongiae]|uniref:hypothetical protein n=1 Tax=Marinobacter xestospongiae TaxID=994319 RepID=UPI002002F098|nr:hypothetical protein [Marinobacter xestospongiae]MCK7566713.1 hypothetical protein [Marinobacter xestospongiae]
MSQEPVAQLVLEKLRALIGDISPDNGFLSNIFQVLEDDPKLFLDQQLPMPLVGIKNTSDQSLRQVHGTSNHSRTFTVVAYVERGQDGQSRQNRLLQDIYRTFYRPDSIELDGTSIAIKTGPAQLDDVNLGTDLLPIYLPITVTFTERNWR